MVKFRVGRMNRAFCALALVAAAAAAVIALSSCSQPPTKTQAQEIERFQPKPREHYRNVLAQLPLRMKPEYQDFSGTDTVTGGAWMEGLHYFNRNDVRELYAVFSNNHIYRVRAEDFTLDWTDDLEFKPKFAPVVSDRYVFFVTEGPRIVWFYREGQPSGYQKRYEEVIRISPSSPPAANDNGIYMGASNNFRMYGFNELAKGWAFFWPTTSSGHGRIAMQPMADDDRVYFYTEDGFIYSISASNGQEFWKWPRSGSETLLARFSEKYGFLFVPTAGSVLFVMDKSSRQLFNFNAGEPIVSTPFVQDYYIVFQTPTRLVCIKAEYVDAGENKTLLRLVSDDELRGGRARPEEPKWSMPLVSPEVATKRYDQILEDPSRRHLRVLMKGREWIYLLEEVPASGEKFIYRVAASTGHFDSEIDPETNQVRYKRYDVTPFPFILSNDDENNRTLYFGTREGYIFGMYE